MARNINESKFSFRHSDRCPETQICTFHLVFFINTCRLHVPYTAEYTHYFGTCTGYLRYMQTYILPLYFKCLTSKVLFQGPAPTEFVLINGSSLVWMYAGTMIYVSTVRGERKPISKQITQRKHYLNVVSRRWSTPNVVKTVNSTKTL